MAQQDTDNTAPRFCTQAAAKQSKTHDVTNFLTYTDRDGFEWSDSPLGLDGLNNSVSLHRSESYSHLIGHPVTLSIRGSGFSLQEYLSTDEARLLAQALTLAADHADRAAAMAPSAEVAA